MADAETILRSIQEGGDIDKDLQVIFWKNTDELEEQIAETFQADVRHIAKKHAGKDSRLDQLWREIISDKDGNKRADVHQIISPYRGDLFGTDNINSIIQNLLYGFYLERKGTLGGITYFDKVIQFVNRPKSYPYRYVYNRKTKSQENLEVFNGEIGYVFPHQSDMWALSKPGHITRFNVTFSRRPDHVVPFSSEGRVTENIESAYAISVHKAQGSEFEHVCFVIPKHKTALLSPELLYTGLTRASRRLTLFIEDDISPLLSFLRPENPRYSKSTHLSSNFIRFRKNFFE